MTKSRSVPAEGATQLALMLGVGSIAACASWSHVVDLAERNGQPGWLAIADAAVLETLAVSMGLDVRRRRRGGESTRFPLCVLVAAVALQLAAQVAQAPMTFWGWTMAALPAVGFLLLVKVAMSRTAAVPTASPAASSSSPVGRPVVDAATPLAHAPGADGDTPTGHAVASTGAGAQADDHLLSAGRAVAADLARHESRLTRASLMAGLRGRGLRIGTARAGELLAALRVGSDRAEHDWDGDDHPDRRLSVVGTRL